MEIQGYGKGHADYMSMANDYEKHNEAIRLKWSILYFMAHDLTEHKIHETIKYTIDTMNTRCTTVLPEHTPGNSAVEIFRRLHDSINEKNK